jgi:hypothetical protein
MRSIREAIFSAAVLALIATRGVAAQEATSEAPFGVRVRVSVLGAAPRVGTLVGQTNDALVVGWSNGTRDTVAMRDVSRLDVSRGSRRHLMFGAVAGAAVGTIGGLLKKMSADDAAGRTRDQNYKTCVTGGGCDALDGSIGEDDNRKLIPIGIALGTAAGALVGLIATEQWRPAAMEHGTLRVGVAPMVTPRGVSLALAAHF